MTMLFKTHSFHPEHNPSNMELEAPALYYRHNRESSLLQADLSDISRTLQDNKNIITNPIHNSLSAYVMISHFCTT